MSNTPATTATPYTDLTRSISTDLGKLRGEIPDTLRGFSALAKAATQDGALDKKTKELIAIALSVAMRCDPCIGFHAQTLVQLGGTRAELAEALGMAIYMGGRPVADVCRQNLGRVRRVQCRRCSRSLCRYCTGLCLMCPCWARHAARLVYALQSLVARWR